MTIHPLVFDGIGDDGDEWSNERTSGHLRTGWFAAPPIHILHTLSRLSSEQGKGGDAYATLTNRSSAIAEL